jgi:hypothetical protein
LQQQTETGALALVQQAFGRPRGELQAAKIVVGDVHGHHRAARQQEGEQIAEIELVVDAQHQQDQQQQGEKPAGAGGQDVDVAVGQPRAAAGRMAR